MNGGARKEGGAGIGMSLVAVILEHHNAKLSVESEPGCGTTMRISLHGKSECSIDV